MQAVQAELDASKELQQNLEQQLAREAEEYQALEQRYQSLAESHNMLSTEYEQTQNQLQIFTAQNQKLIEKNRVAAEHTKLVLERLAKIDSEN